MAADPAELFGHVKDSTAGHHGFHLPFEGFLPIPQPFYDAETGSGFLITKFMFLELVVAAVILIVFIVYARKISGGRLPRGRFWNMVEIMLLFIRNNIARPAIGRKDADRFLPFLWTAFFFVLGCNLMGIIPFAGSPTGTLGATGALACMTLLTVTGAGMMKFGVFGFWIGQVPHMELPLVMAIFIKPMVFCIEVVGMGVKHLVLAVRLLANIFAGHLVLAVLLSFIAATAELHLLLWSGVALASILGTAVLSLLELFVAFLQAYIFAFLSALFIGMAVHQH